MTLDNERPRNFLFVTVDGGGNLAPIVAIADELVRRENRVRFLMPPGLFGSIPETRKEMVTAGGSELTEFFPTGSDPDIPPLRHALFGRSPEKVTPPPQFIHLIYGRAAAFASAVVEEHRREPVDVVAADELIPGSVVGAQAVGLPVALMVHSVFRGYRRSIPPGPGFLPSSNPVQLLRRAFFRAMLSRLLRFNALPGLNAARVQHGLAPLSSVIEHQDNIDRVLVLSPRAFEFDPGPLPPNVRYAGYPVDLKQKNGGWMSPWPADDTRPLVVLSPSTTGQAQEQHGFVKQALIALGQLDVRGLLTVGPSADPASFDPPDNVAVEQFVPHADVLPHTSLMMTHCGHGTVMTALAHGRAR